MNLMEKEELWLEDMLIADDEHATIWEVGCSARVDGNILSIHEGSSNIIKEFKVSSDNLNEAVNEAVFVNTNYFRELTIKSLKETKYGSIGYKDRCFTTVYNYGVLTLKDPFVKDLEIIAGDNVLESLEEIYKLSKDYKEQVIVDMASVLYNHEIKELMNKRMRSINSQLDLGEVTEYRGRKIAKINNNLFLWDNNNDRVLIDFDENRFATYIEHYPKFIEFFSFIDLNELHSKRYLDILHSYEENLVKKYNL